MNDTDVQNALRELGWPITVDGVVGPQTRAAVSDFQAGYAFQNLDVDGQAGPMTHEALRHSLSRGGRCGEYFTFSEFKSKGNGWIKVNRVHVFRLDRYREAVGRPVSIISGYRDPAHNKRVGGATSSRHMFGDATDIVGLFTLDQMRALRLFTGLGVASNGRVVHCDSRPGDPANPTIWRYG